MSSDLDESFDSGDARRAEALAAALPPGWAVRAVTGTHRKPCARCDCADFESGDYYVFNAAQPWGTDKYCLDCAEVHFLDGSVLESDEGLSEGNWSDEESDEEFPDGEESDEDDLPSLCLKRQKHADGGTYDSTGWQKWPVVQDEDYGLVYVASGRYKGRFVYYDCGEDGIAEVYLGLPMVSECRAVPLSSLRQPPFPGKLFSGCEPHDPQLGAERPTKRSRA